MYYGGGSADNEVHKYSYDLLIYHSNLNKWTQLSVKSFGLGAFNGKLIAVGGITMGGEESRKVYTYDETTESRMPL